MAYAALLIWSRIFFRRHYIDKNMLPKTYLFIFFFSNAMRSGSTVFESYHGIKTNEPPKSSCHKIDDIRSKGQCLGACVTTMDKIVMISHDESTKTCMCCNDITGSDITDPTWKSYVPRSCKYWFLWYALKISIPLRWSARFQLLRIRTISRVVRIIQSSDDCNDQLNIYDFLLLVLISYSRTV